MILPREVQLEQKGFELGAILSDYDGTLAPDEVRRKESRIPKLIGRELQALAEEIPLAIITSKDFSFVYPRARFPSAWACVSGLEIVGPRGRLFLEDHLQGLDAIARQVRERIRETCSLELKWSSTGHLLGFSIDWRYSPKLSSETIKSLLDEFSEEGLYVNYEEPHPFIDVYAAAPNKGKALHRLKDLLGIRGPVMYLGDSMMDNEAFLVADVPVCVLHGQPTDRLSCKFAVRYDELGLFLRALREAGLVFRTKGFPMLIGRNVQC